MRVARGLLHGALDGLLVSVMAADGA